jgi:thiol-disulfide isomerase/thioredoxin
MFKSTKKLITENKKKFGVGISLVVIIIVAITVTVVLKTKKKEKKGKSYTTQEMFLDMAARLKAVEDAKTQTPSSPPPATTTLAAVAPTRVETLPPTTRDIGDQVRTTTRDAMHAPIDTSRDSMQKSGDANAYIEALKKTKQNRSLAESANVRDEQSAKLWKEGREKLASQIENIPGVDPSEGMMGGGVSGMSMSAFNENEAHVGAMINEEENTGGKTEEEKAPRFVIEGDENLQDSEQAPNLKQIFAGKRSAVVVFYSDNCPACHQMMPEFEKAAQDYTQFHISSMKQSPTDPAFAVWLRVNVNKNPVATKTLELKATPTIYRFTASSTSSPKIAEYDFKLLSEAKRTEFRRTKGLLEFAESVILPDQ